MSSVGKLVGIEWEKTAEFGGNSHLVPGGKTGKGGFGGDSSSSFSRSSHREPREKSSLLPAREATANGNSHRSAGGNRVGKTGGKAERLPYVPEPLKGPRDREASAVGKHRAKLAADPRFAAWVGLK